jgi:predicted DNA-binding WGR domain protein
MADLNNVRRIRLEYEDESSHKFYELEFTGGPGIYAGDYTATYGRIGTEGQTHRYSRLEAQKKLNEKIAKGYRVVRHEEFARSATEALDDLLKKIPDPRKEKPKALKKEEADFDFMEELRKL